MPRRVALKVLASSSEAVVAKLKHKMIRTRNASFFMFEFLLLTGTLQESVSEGNAKDLSENHRGGTPRQPGILSLIPRGIQCHTMAEVLFPRPPWVLLPSHLTNSLRGANPVKSGYSPFLLSIFYVHFPSL